MSEENKNISDASTEPDSIKWVRNQDDVKICELAPIIIDHRIIAGKLSETNWLGDLPDNSCPPEVVEVRFKNTRKAFFLNPSKLQLKEGDIVAVEAALGHDIGVISLVGPLVEEQMRIKRVDTQRNPLKKIYRKAKNHDIEKWQQAIGLEHETMIRSRQIAVDLGLNMKIGDVEYQGDKTKAIFYYIADERVDFRVLIKVLAETFHIRIEMKQIGARQEAGRIGGIGSCGRQLCCSAFISNFVSVSTSAARYQDISLNPQKLAGQCGKLKCCLNYEADAYIDIQKDFPSNNQPLNTGEGMLYFQKADILNRKYLYTYDKEGHGALITLSVDRVREVLAMNRKGVIPPKVMDENAANAAAAPKPIGYTDGVGEESLNRFDDKRSSRRRGGRNNNRPNNSNRPNNNRGGNNGEGNANGGNRPNNNREDGANNANPNRPNNNRNRDNRNRGGNPNRNNRPNNGNRGGRPSDRPTENNNKPVSDKTEQ